MGVGTVNALSNIYTRENILEIYVKTGICYNFCVELF